jgi:hypothetical protein
MVDVGYEPDDEREGVWVEVKSGTHSFRNVRASLLGMASLLAAEPGRRGLLVLADSRITEERLKQEIEIVERTLRPDVAQRLFLVIEKDDRYVGLPSDLHNDFRSWLDGLIRSESGHRKPRTSHFAVLQVLVHQWLLDKGPMTTNWIMDTVGCSYPTAASALRRLDDVLIRHSDRRVELRRFPREDWARLVAMSDEARSTARFVDRSGQRRSPEALRRRLASLGRADVAIGGVDGARHHDSALDLVGTPRLDLSVHCPTHRVDLAFVKRLDPALEKSERREESAAVVVHLVWRKASLFQAGDDGVQWADPVECLLDLHEARLEPQAKELVEYFSSRRAP